MPDLNNLRSLALIALMLLAGLSTQLSAQATPDVEEFAWIAGDWHGNAMGGSFEESWNAPSGGGMLGMFKFVSDGKISFYEILTIVPKDDSFVLRLKHFDGKLVGWEEKEKSIEFPLISVSPTAAKFDGLTFTLLNDDRMDIVVVTQEGDKVQELEFECHRAPAKPNGPSEPSEYAAQINRILEIDGVLAKQRDLLPAKQSLKTAVETYVLGLRGLDFSKCPPEFTTAFAAHREAWSNSATFFANHLEIRGEMHHAIDEIRALNAATARELDTFMAPIFETWKEVEKQADRYKNRDQKNGVPSNK